MLIILKFVVQIKGKMSHPELKKSLRRTITGRTTEAVSVTPSSTSAFVPIIRQLPPPPPPLPPMPVPPLPPPPLPPLPPISPPTTTAIAATPAVTAVTTVSTTPTFFTNLFGVRSSPQVATLHDIWKIPQDAPPPYPKQISRDVNSLHLEALNRIQTQVKTFQAGQHSFQETLTMMSNMLTVLSNNIDGLQQQFKIHEDRQNRVIMDALNSYNKELVSLMHKLNRMDNVVSGRVPITYPAPYPRYDNILDVKSPFPKKEYTQPKWVLMAQLMNYIIRQNKQLKETTQAVIGNTYEHTDGPVTQEEAHALCQLTSELLIKTKVVMVRQATTTFQLFLRTLYYGLIEQCITPLHLSHFLATLVYRSCCYAGEPEQSPELPNCDLYPQLAVYLIALFQWSAPGDIGHKNSTAKLVEMALPHYKKKDIQEFYGNFQRAVERSCYCYYHQTEVLKGKNLHKLYLPSYTTFMESMIRQPSDRYTTSFLHEVLYQYKKSCLARILASVYGYITPFTPVTIQIEEQHAKQKQVFSPHEFDSFRDVLARQKGSFITQDHRESFIRKLVKVKELTCPCKLHADEGWVHLPCYLPPLTLGDTCTPGDLELVKGMEPAPKKIPAATTTTTTDSGTNGEAIIEYSRLPPGGSTCPSTPEVAVPKSSLDSRDLPPPMGAPYRKQPSCDESAETIVIQPPPSVSAADMTSSEESMPDLFPQ